MLELDSLSPSLLVSLVVGGITLVVYRVMARPRAPTTSLPSSMRRLVVLEAEGRDIKDYTTRVEEVPLPVPGPGEVLVRMAAAVVNPSDMGDRRGAAAGGAKLPRVFGREGAGEVVASGGGLMAGRLVGKKVWGGDYHITPHTHIYTQTPLQLCNYLF